MPKYRGSTEPNQARKSVRRQRSAVRCLALGGVGGGEDRFGLANKAFSCIVCDKLGLGGGGPVFLRRQAGVGTWGLCACMYGGVPLPAATMESVPASFWCRRNPKV